VSAEAVEIVQRIQSPLVGRDVVAAFDDADAQRLLGETFGQYAHPDFEVSMIGPDYLPNTREARGTEGFGELWGDWTSAFATFRIEVEDVIDAGDAVVSLVRQIGTTKTGGAEIETPAAAVWTVRDGLLRRVEFHLHRDAAFRAAGLDPDEAP
jgi:ketosteroid isomerase-like protein